jgi:hypothetical protein
MTRRTRTSSPGARAFSLVECAISMVLVATMFAAGMAAAGSAARDRRTQSNLRTGQRLAAQLLNEIVQQRYVDPAKDTIAPAAGVSTTDRSNWTHIDDYTGFSQTPPVDRSGKAVAGAAGWTWQATVAYEPVSTPSTAPPGSGGFLGGLLGAVGGAVSATLGTSSGSASDTGLKRIIVTVTSPHGKVTTLTALRCSAGAVDRVSTGFHDFAALGVTVGRDKRAADASAPLLNSPAAP